MSLPDIGYVRIHQIIGQPSKGIPAVIPVSRSTWWAGCKSGRFPAGRLLGPGIRVWDVAEIRAMLAAEVSQ